MYIESSKEEIENTYKKLSYIFEPIMSKKEKKQLEQIYKETIGLQKNINEKEKN